MTMKARSTSASASAPCSSRPNASSSSPSSSSPASPKPEKDTPSTPRPPKFLRCLYDILYHEDQSILSWAKDGTHFQIYSIPRLELEVLRKYFKHGKFASFQRQLNNFGFRKWTKTQSSTCTFSHHHYVHCAPEQLATLVAQHSSCAHLRTGVIGMAANAPLTVQHSKRKRSEHEMANMYASPNKKVHGIMPYGYLRTPSAAMYESDAALWDMVADVTSSDWSARNVKQARGNDTPTSATGVADLRFEFGLEEMDELLPTAWPSGASSASSSMYRECDVPPSYEARALYNSSYAPSYAHASDSTLAWDNDMTVRSEMDFFLRETASHSALVEPTPWGARHAL